MSTSAIPRANRGPAAAAGNRRALIAAAREVYADGGLNAPFSAVAKRAGVGQGSLYRHFADRTALAVAVFEDNIADLEDYIAAPDRTIDDLFDRVVEQAIVSAALIELVTADLRDPRVVPLGYRFQAVVSGLVERERAAGRIGAHVETEDVVMAIGMLGTELARADPSVRSAVADRATRLFRAAFAPR
ncbi:helix-turn-helix domain-containing protein [Microbacterium sp. CFBP9034]|uniref:helix-turn-helix domain-containing protein n=1 Tax=Microbacterium sp. CFBP9034 TaxID=3096540 RepID=UPI002A6A25CE|nr:helix-turn-helix domain-containing protein [Microbacterium sp. CFBP9034]MDY0910217.1 helix-turn-helix domain-containing protein [Microbacterium sp. CFBP9034]